MAISSGIASGISAGQSAVIQAAVTAAQSALSAAKAALAIQSPSRVFRDEVGVMTMRGFGEGVELETRNQAEIIANAARYLTSEARYAAAGSSSVSNRNTYNQHSTISFAGSTFVIRSESDIHSLAVELADLATRKQRGVGH